MDNVSQMNVVAYALQNKFI